MADRVETFAISCTGGLVTNQPTLAQASQMPGTARELINFEPSVEGGYRRINGYTKWSGDPISIYPTVWTQQAYSSGVSSINVGGWYYLNTGGSGPTTFTVAGSSTVYTVTSISAVSGSAYDTIVTFSFTPNLTVNLTGRQAIFVHKNYNINRSVSLLSSILIGENGNIENYSTSVKSRTPLFLSLGNYKSGNFFYSRVDGAGQTGNTLNIKNLKHKPIVGDCFWFQSTFFGVGMHEIFGVSNYSQTAGTATLQIFPSLSSSTVNNSLISWVRRPQAMAGSNLMSNASYSKGSVSYSACPCGNGYPLIVTPNLYYEPVSELYDLLFDEEDGFLYSAAYYKNHMFWADRSKLYFSSPYDEFDYKPANGAGNIVIPGAIQGIRALRDSLIIFCTENIFRIIGSDASTFKLETVTERTGCVDGLSIQEINGDVMFLSSTGLSRLSDTDQQSGLGISVISNTIKTEINELLSPVANTSETWHSVFIPTKGQYKVFKWADTISVENTMAVVGSQVSLNPAEISWSIVKGIKPVNISFVSSLNKTLFINDNGQGQTTYIYEMDSGNTFDGTNITATYSTPYYHMNDPRVRKAFLNLETTVEPEGAVTITVDTLLNYSKSDVIQPPAVVIGTTGTTYGDNTSPSYVTPLIGNGDVVSLKFTSNTNIPPYVIQSFTIEYSTNDRR